jgi:prepilin-type N-terminal cleavage/methylation domain-containing protein
MSAPEHTTKLAKAAARASRRGFTLIEMLTVMVIIIILLAVGGGGYFGMRRGAEMRAAVTSVRTTLALARQQAVTRRKTVSVVFRQTSSNATYYVFERGGTVSGGGSGMEFEDASGNVSLLGNHAGESVCNMNPDRGSIGTVRSNGIDRVMLDPPGLDDGGPWESGDMYGWSAHARAYLPPGVQFVDGGGNPAAPRMIIFTPDGTGGGAGKTEIVLRERIGSPPQEATVVLYKLTGLTTVVQKK